MVPRTDLEKAETSLRAQIGRVAMFLKFNIKAIL